MTVAKTMQHQKQDPITIQAVIGQKVWKAIAIARTQSERMEKYLDFCRLHYATGKINAIIRYKKKVLASCGSDQEVLHSLKKIKKPDKEKNIALISLGNGIVLVIQGESELSELGYNHIKACGEELRFKYRSKKTLYCLLCAFFLVGFMPINDRVFVNGSVNGELTTVISAPVSGVLSEINVRYGSVSVNQNIAHVDSEIEYDLEQAHLEAERLKVQLQNQGAFVTENASKLQADIRDAEAKVKYLEDQYKRENIIASVDGVIEWKEDVLGSLVTKGDPLGQIQKMKQDVITADVPMKDWIPISVGAQATFVADNDYTKRIHGTVCAVPPTVTPTPSGPGYRVKIKIDTPLEVGTTGMIGVSGERINIFWYFFRKPLAYLLAIIGR